MGLSGIGLTLQGIRNCVRPPSAAGQMADVARVIAPIAITPDYHSKLRWSVALGVCGIFLLERFVRSLLKKGVEPPPYLPFFVYDGMVLGATLASFYFNPYRQPKTFSLDGLGPEIVTGVVVLFGLWRHTHDIKGRHVK